MTTENHEDSYVKEFGFELKEAYKIALKFYKGKIQLWYIPVVPTSFIHEFSKKVQKFLNVAKGEKNREILFTF